MKLRLKEKQYNLLLEYLEEARKAPKPEKLSLFFNDNPNAQFFSVIQKIKGGSESEYDFKISEANGFKTITDINKGTKTKGCTIDANFDSMIYGNQFSINFGKCGSLNINNVIGLKIYNDLNSLKSKQPSDTFEIEHDLDKNNTELIDKYFEELKNVESTEEVFFDSKYKYDGRVIQKFGTNLRIELIQQGKNKNIILSVDVNQNPFYEENGEIMFKAKASSGEEEQTDFIIPIKKFFVNEKDAAPIEKPKLDDKVEDTEEIKRDGKRAMEVILSDPNLKKAFYSQPSLWNLFVAELKGKKAVGKGIVPTLRIVHSYENKSLSQKLQSEFIEGRKVSFRPVETIQVPFIRNDKDLTYTFDKTSNLEYHPIVMRRKLGQSFKLKGKLEDYLGYEIELLNKLEDSPNTFECSISMIVIKESTTSRYPYDGKFIIKIDGAKSPGYLPKTNI